MPRPPRSSNRPHGARPQHPGSRGGGGDRGPREEREPFHAPRYVPPPAPPRPDDLHPTDREFRGLRLYPFQARAVDAIAADHSVLVAAPTGSGKTLVADYAIDQAFAAGRRVVYTSPIKALSNQKFRDFRARHGDAVGIMTGDVTMNGDAPLLVMTTEVFRNTLFDEPARIAQFAFVVHDEVHYLDDPERGTVWEESIIHAPSTMRLVCLSATVPNVRELADWIASVRGEEVTVVEMAHRPVPLDHMLWRADAGPVPVANAASMKPPPRSRSRPRRERSPWRLLDWLERERLLPLLYFCFSRKDCEALAIENRNRTLLTPHERERMSGLLDDLFRRFEVEDSQAVRRLRDLALAGVSYHHAGMLPIHKEVVERIFTSGLVRMLFATETFALGVNMPARTVAFDSLRKFDGERMNYMLCREYGQMAGRAGRQGIDAHGLVVSRVDPQYDSGKNVLRVLTGPPESVESRFDPDYSTILALYDHMGDRVVETYEKSFAKFQRETRRGRTGGRSAEERILATRLANLKAHGFIADGRLTAKGEFTSHVSGHEIQAAQWREAGLLGTTDLRALGALLLSASYEPRIDDDDRPPRDRTIREVAERAMDVVEDWREAERRAGLTDVVKAPHFGMAGVLVAWMEGQPLSRCREMTSGSEGDIVRWLRQMLQYARQIQRALGDEEPEVRARLTQLVRTVNRDEVDAKRQLELGRDPVEGADDVPPPAPRPRTPPLAPRAEPPPDEPPAEPPAERSPERQPRDRPRGRSRDAARPAPDRPAQQRAAPDRPAPDRAAPLRPDPAPPTPRPAPPKPADDFGIGIE